MKKILILGLTIILTGCNMNGELESWQTDQALRQKIFKDCMESLPAGPQSTHYNDWSEVVDSCDTAAYRQSQKLMRKDRVKGWVPVGEN